MWKTCALIAVLILAAHRDTFCQRFQSINDALPFARTRCVYQDSYGFLWFGTEDGLVKYDGLEAKVFRNTPGDPNSLPGQEIHAVVQNSDSTLFLGFQDKGLVLFNRNTGVCQTIPLLPKNERLTVFCLFVDTSGMTWVGTNVGLFSLSGDIVKHYPAKSREYPGLLNPIVHEVYQDRHMNLWVGTRGGVHRLDVETGIFENSKTNPTFPDKIIIDIEEDMEGKLWVSVRVDSNRLYMWDEEASRFNAVQRFTRDGEYRIDFDANNDMWISSRGRGIYRVAGETETYFDPAQPWKHGFWGLGVFDVLHDKYRNIWVLGEEVLKRSGDNKGFNNLDGGNFVVHSVYADDQYIWYCWNEAVRWNRETGHSEQFLADVELAEIRNPVAIRSQSRIHHFEEWGEDLIMSTTRNLIWWDRSEDKFTDFPTDAGGPLRDVVIDTAGYAWIAVNQRKPMRMNLNTGDWIRPDALGRAWTTHAVARAQDGVLWWGNRLQGLFSFDPVSEELVQYVPSSDTTSGALSSYTVHDILCHSDGTVWVGTKFGLDHIDPETREVYNYPFEGRNINTQITSILEGEGGILWLGTKNGLLFLDPKTDSLRRFTPADNLINTVYTARACYRDRHGVLYFGGDAGVDYFHPDDIGTNPVAPDLYIKSASVNNRSLTQNVAGENLTEVFLSHQENFIEIELLGLHLASPNSVTYAYRLPMQSSEWIDLGKNRVITLARLPHGEYHLEAKCANGDGIWSEPKVLLSIYIQPPFWQAWWFLSLISLLILASVYALYKFRINQIKRAERVKTEFSKQIAEIEMKALRAQMNPHFLFNSLNSVRLLIDKGDNAQAKIYLTKYSKLIRKVLNNSRKKFIRLDEELVSLRLYLELEKMRFKNFSFEIRIDEDVETDFLDVPPLLLQPFVENAIWHGLMNKEQGDRRIDIEVKKINSIVTVVIEDNGIGRENARRFKTRSTSKKESLGIRISTDRLGFLKELYGTEVKVEIVDLQNPTGTKVIIQIPVSD